MFLLNENLNIMLGHEIGNEYKFSGSLHHTGSVFNEMIAGRQRERVSNLCKEEATNLCREVQRSAKKCNELQIGTKKCKGMVVFNKKCKEVKTGQVLQRGSNRPL